MTNPWLVDFSADAKPHRSPSLPPTKAEERLAAYYETLAPVFYRSLLRIASENKVSVKTVQRANARFRELGRLKWDSGHGGSEGHNTTNCYHWTGSEFGND